MSSIGIVGAGLSGLVAAHRLRQSGHDVTVYESAEHAGGRAHSFQWEGQRIATGAHLFYGYSKALRGLVAELGLQTRVTRLKRLRARCIGDAATWSVDMAPDPGFLLSKDFTPAEKFRAAHFMAGIVLGLRGADGDDATSTLRHDAETLRDFCDRRLGADLADRLIGVVYRGARGIALDEISPSSFLGMMRGLCLDRSVNVMEGGIGTLSEALAQGLDLRPASPVREVREDADGCTLHFGTGHQPARHDAAIVAVEGSRAARLLPGLAPPDRLFLESCRYNATLYLHLLLPTPLGGGQWFLGGSRFQWISALKLSGANLPDGTQGAHAMLTIAPERLREHGLDLPVEDLLRHAVPEAARVVPGLEAPPLATRLQPIARKTPLFTPGYGAALAAYRSRRKASGGRLALAGDYLCQPLLGGAVRSGELAARQIGKRLGS